MDYVRRVALLRATALIAIAVSAVLTVDHISPGRDFCPLAEACAAARDSALGSIGGVPTSVIGMAAFGALLLLTLLPLEWARPLLKPVGAVAAVAGLAFIAYQRLVLNAFCPLCLVADGAGFIAGVLTMTWPRLPARRSGRHIRWEGGSSRMAWTMAGLLAAVVPFAIPRPVDPGFVEITPVAENLFSLEEEEKPPVVTAEAPPAPAHPASVAAGPEDTSTPDGPPVPAAADTAAITAPLPTPSLPDEGPPAGPAPAVMAPQPAKAPASETPVVATAPQPTPPPAPRAPVVRKAPEPPAPLLVEYLNAFCGHCRATHKRLHAVLEETGVTVRRRRIYTWAGKSTPAWARACAYAATVGLEDRMFEELLKARRPTTREIMAAGKRAGLDPRGLDACLARRTVPKRLLRDKRLVQTSRIRKLPTIDIGRRRLMGSQSIAELRSAILAATGQS